MSGPYDNQGYGSYQNNNYNQGGYGQHGQQGYNQYPPQQQHHQSGYPPQDFGPPQRQDSYGPPQQGGFQHGQQGGQYGAYDASNPQGHAGYYGGYPEHQQQQHQYQQHNPGQDAFAANQQYQNTMSSQQHGGPTPNPNHQFQKQSTDPNAPNYDQNAPPMTETDRGMLGALGGAFGGHHFGAKQGHGILGTIGGAIAGSLAEDFFKDKKKNKHSSSGYGGSSWGGGSKW